MKNVINIEVPPEVEYISEWKNFEYPQGHLILDKTICGCGFTEYCLTNNIPIILCSPRISLLQNKKNQHKENNVFHFKNDYTMEVYDSDKVDKIDTTDKEDYLFNLKEDLKEWSAGFAIPGLGTPKILVTYDSFHHIKEALGENIKKYAIVVDEFQSIFMDAAFKADIEMDFLEELQSCENVLYLSATPMLDKYLSDLDYFKDLDFYKLIWPKARVENVRIERRFTRSINEVLAQYIKKYREGDFPNKFTDEGIKYSEELVIFVNSVKTIHDVIKKNKMKPEEVNIICSNTLDNVNKLKKIGHQIGTVPLKGEKHKMFTFCTRTTYLGNDFYSTSAYTIICSDANIKTLTVDISLDLPQIIGRQRLKENVFRNEVLFLYKAASKNESTLFITEEEYEKKIEAKTKETNKLLSGYAKMTDEEKESWSMKAADVKSLYLNDFLGVSSKTGKVVFNNLVKIADRRAFDVTRKDYQDNVTIKRCMGSIENCNIEVTEDDVVNEILLRFITLFESHTFFKDKMNDLCCLAKGVPAVYESNKEIFPREMVNYISMIGPDKILALGCEEKPIKEFIEANVKIKENISGILNLFEVGKTYTRAEIKDMLKQYYSEAGIKRTPKASDLEEYFELSDIKITNKETGKRDHGFKIIKKK